MDKAEMIALMAAAIYSSQSDLEQSAAIRRSIETAEEIWCEVIRRNT